MDDKYLPDGFTFKELSKLSKSEIYECLKFWYGHQQDRGIETMFKFHCIKGKDGKPQEVPIEDVVPNKRKKPSRKQRTGKKGKAEEDPDDVNQSEEDAQAPAPKKTPTNKGKGKTKSRPQRGEEEETSSSTESPSDSNEEEDLEYNTGT